jgi:hypothetical protein
VLRIRLSVMSWTDAIETAHQFLPRRWKRHVGACLVVAAPLFPTPVSEAIKWYANEKARELLSQLQPLLSTPRDFRLPANLSGRLAAGRRKPGCRDAGLPQLGCARFSTPARTSDTGSRVAE